MSTRFSAVQTIYASGSWNGCEWAASIEGRALHLLVGALQWQSPAELDHAA
ncbi:MAG: hypothetical protein ACLPX1_08485 [Steroidobacteraceae bacterium]